LNSTFNNFGGNVHWSLGTPEAESSGVDMIYLLLEEHGTLILEHFRGSPLWRLEEVECCVVISSKACISIV